jgi:hypothetical protein
MPVATAHAFQRGSVAEGHATTPKKNTLTVEIKYPSPFRSTVTLRSPSIARAPEQAFWRAGFATHWDGKGSDMLV